MKMANPRMSNPGAHPDLGIYEAVSCILDVGRGSRRGELDVLRVEVEL